MFLVVIILASLAVGLGGLFLLAKSQKENLGKLYSVSAYVTITIAALIILFSIAIATVHCCKDGKHGCGGKKCKTEKCEGKKSKCGGASSCKMSKMGGSSCSMSSGQCSSKMKGCSGGDMKCSKGGNCMMMNAHGGHMMEKKIIRKMEGDSVEVQVEIGHK